MRAFLYPICSVALAVAATSSLAQSNASPIDNGFFRPVVDLALTAPPRETAPLVPAQPVATPAAPVTVVVQPPQATTSEATEIAKREQERRAAVWRLEQQRIETERQNAPAR